MSRDYMLYIKDIIEAIDKIDEFVGDMEFNEFLEDEKTNNSTKPKLMLS